MLRLERDCRKKRCYTLLRTDSNILGGSMLTGIIQWKGVLAVPLITTLMLS